MMTAVPGQDCPLCPRLVALREQQRREHPDWYNAPVPSFGSADARLLIVGLAPGRMGANRTGRPFTGDWAGWMLYGTLADFGFVHGRYDARPDDGLELVDARIANAVRCLPPENKPTGAEITTCRRFLHDEFASLPRLRVVLPLGAVAHGSVVRTLGLKASAHPFRHGGVLEPDGGPVIVSSYHCSRYNTNTGRLTEAMFRDVFTTVRALIPEQPG